MGSGLDVVVVGGGLAGLTAANRAAELGLSVTVLEKGAQERYLCNTRYSNGAINCAFQDVNDDPQRLRRKIDERSGGHAVPELAEAYARNAAAAVRWLHAQGVETVRGSLVSSDFNMLAPLVMSPNPALAWQGKGPDVAISRLGANLAERGGKLLRGVRATGLIMRDGRCTGVSAVQDGRSVRFDARAAVLCDGGFQASTELLGRFICRRPERLMQRNSGSGTGDGLRMAMAAGTRLVEMEWFYGHILSRDAMNNDALWPNLNLDGLVCAGIAVDALGRRFAEEKTGGVFMTNAIARLDDPLGACAVFDHALWEDVGRKTQRPPNPLLDRLGATVYRADALEALAARAGLPAAALGESVRSFNAAAAKPIRAAPFYAVPLCAGISYTLGGMLTDSRCRVVHEDGHAIEGLYAAGSTTGGIDGGPSAGQNGGLGKSLTFGWLAGNCIAEGLNKAA